MGMKNRGRFVASAILSSAASFAFTHFATSGVTSAEYVNGCGRLRSIGSCDAGCVAARMKSEVEWLQRNASEAEDSPAYVDSVMRPCLSYLEASGL